MSRYKKHSSLGKGLLSIANIFCSASSSRGKFSMWQMNAGTSHGGRKKHKGILGF